MPDSKAQLARNAQENCELLLEDEKMARRSELVKAIIFIPRPEALSIVCVESVRANVQQMSPKKILPYNPARSVGGIKAGRGTSDEE